MRKAAIVATGLYHPEKKVTNQFFNELYKKDIDSFLVEKRNIRQRYFMSENQTTSDLVVEASQKALSSCGLSPKDIDLIIVATDTPDYISPSTASVVQNKLQAINAGTFDVNTACAGFVTALDIASKYIACDEKYQNVLVVGAYGMSKYLNWDDYKIASLFADGAGAVILQPSKNYTGILATELYTDGQYHDYMGIYAGGTFKPVTHEVIEKKEHLLNFAKKIPLETNSVNWPRLTRKILGKIHKTEKDVKKFFLTQINIGTINEALDKLGLPHTCSHNVMDKFGYTGSACIPMALADAENQHLLKKGDLLFLLGSGGGVSMAALAMEWSYDT